MTSEEFVEVFGNRGLQEYVKQQAKRHARRIDIREEYEQEAWLAISCAPPDLTEEAYRSIAYKAIYSGYWQQNKERLLAAQSFWPAYTTT